MRNALLLLLLGCPAGGPTVTELVDVGTFCIDGFGTYGVDFDTCLSSSCDTLEEVSCEGTLDGDRLILNTYARIVSEGEECTADCGLVHADCELPVIDNTVDTGALVVVIGDEEFTFRNPALCN